MNEIFNNKYISQISLTEEKLLEHVSSFSKKKIMKLLI